MPEADRNILRYMLTSRDAGELFGDSWAQEAQRMIAMFRTTYDQRRGDPLFEEMVSVRRLQCLAARASLRRLSRSALRTSIGSLKTLPSDRTYLSSTELSSDMLQSSKEQRVKARFSVSSSIRIVHFTNSHSSYRTKTNPARVFEMRSFQRWGTTVPTFPSINLNHVIVLFPPPDIAMADLREMAELLGSPDISELYDRNSGTASISIKTLLSMKLPRSNASRMRKVA